MNKNDISEFDGIILCSGDGLIHETINAGTDKVIGALPGGTSNSYIFNMLKRRNLDHTLENSVFMVLKGNMESHEVLEIQMRDRTVYSFLFFSIGLLADIDIESERLRFLGELRYDIYAIYAWWRYKMTE